VAGPHPGVPALTAPRAPGIAWDWPGALRGAVFAIPAAAVAPFDVTNGIALALGVLPAALVGIAPVRRDRARVVLLGSLVGVAILFGSVLANVPVLAVLAIVALAVGAAVLSTRRAIGGLVMTLALPMVGIGLSYSEVTEGVAIAALMIAGSVYAFLVSLLWPERPEARAEPESAPATPVRPMIFYCIRLGLAGGTAAAIGFALDFDHVGWACAAALLVMRPSTVVLEVRCVGRVLSVIAGALVGAALAHLTTAPGWYRVATLVAVAGAAATRPSRWYLTPAFTTFLVFSLLLYANVDTAPARFGERVGETLLGVALAFVFGRLVPTLVKRRRASRPASLR
jgi:uncharacterized membrane protein YccC